ncbi:MAG: hypothetical protein GWN84_20830 [Gammaproteobacteria bacterium]|nr:hypothetical protein [Gammaproteobacteria bacterium]NIR85206.1 hypothetical protein [Gammaproteobacteria bacterium]NIU06256.1 hypothetical protein [Gammaproteobacteria bacterium]NIX87529.1 hypothetical protein [Gammaproteobacteria bacterium]
MSRPSPMAPIAEVRRYCEVCDRETRHVQWHRLRPPVCQEYGPAPDDGQTLERAARARKQRRSEGPARPAAAMDRPAAAPTPSTERSRWLEGVRSDLLLGIARARMQARRLGEHQVLEDLEALGTLVDSALGGRIDAERARAASEPLEAP